MRSRNMSAAPMLVALLFTCSVTFGITPGEPFPPSALHWPVSPKYDVPPRLIHGITPNYTRRFTLPRVRGNCVVRFTVGLDGLPHDVHVVSSTYPAFGRNTVVAVRGWKFLPGRKNGRPVPVTENILMSFH